MGSIEEESHGHHIKQTNDWSKIPIFYEKMGGSIINNYQFISFIFALSFSTPTSCLPTVQWYAPFFSGGGYCSEAITFVQSLDEIGGDVSIVHHGDSFNQEFVSGLPPTTRQMLQSMTRKKPSSNTVSVCHSEPG
jgi:hypothetical protein